MTGKIGTVGSLESDMKRGLVEKLKLPAVKPRNAFAVHARARRAGKHQARNERQSGRQETARQLNEAA